MSEEKIVGEKFEKQKPPEQTLEIRFAVSNQRSSFESRIQVFSKSCKFTVGYSKF